jgi:hypothetical protein
MSDSVEIVHKMISEYVLSVGMNPTLIYDSIKRVWSWKSGSANIQVYVEGVAVSNDKVRYYLRIFSPLMQVPPTDQLYFFRYLLELNDSKLGVKLTVFNGWVYATYERDIRGMDYEELAVCIADLEWWADTLDDQLKAKFAGGI